MECRSPIRNHSHTSQKKIQRKKTSMNTKLITERDKSMKQEVIGIYKCLGVFLFFVILLLYLKMKSSYYVGYPYKLNTGKKNILEQLNIKKSFCQCRTLCTSALHNSSACRPLCKFIILTFIFYIRTLGTSHHVTLLCVMK